jgi:hypothetical protein
MGTTTPSQNENSANNSRADQAENIQEQAPASSSESPVHRIPGAVANPDTDESTHEHWLLFEAWRVGIK